MLCHLTLTFAEVRAFAVSFRPAGGASSLKSLPDLAQQPSLGKHGGLTTAINAAAQAGIKGALKGGWGLLTELAALHCCLDFQLVETCWGLHTAVHALVADVQQSCWLSLSPWMLCAGGASRLQLAPLQRQTIGGGSTPVGVYDSTAQLA